MSRAETLFLLKDLPDDAILGLTLYGEARGEPISGQIAVGCTIRNRLNDPKHRWGQSYRDICLQPKQFSCWNDGSDQNHADLMKAASLLLQKGDPPPVLEQCAWIALGLVRGAILDTVKGANHYHTALLNPRPSWAQTYVPIKQVDHHVFYRL